MLVVIAVISILMGIGASFAFRFSRAMELESETGKVVSLLNLARDTALATGQPASLRFTRENGDTVTRILGCDTVGAFPMEDATGAYGMTFTPGTATFTAGLVGQALLCKAGDTVALGTSPRWGFAEGFLIACDVNVTALNAPAALLTMPGQFTLSLVPADGTIHLTAVIRRKDAVDVTLDGAAVSFDRRVWARVGLGLIGRTARMYLNNTPVADLALGDDLNPAATGNLTLLASGGTFAGRVDGMMIQRWGVINSGRLAGPVTLKQLEDNLADADPDNDFCDYAFTADGTPTAGQTATLDLKFKRGAGAEKAAAIEVPATGLAYRKGG